jgi:hypothetical protein
MVNLRANEKPQVIEDSITEPITWEGADADGAAPPLFAAVTTARSRCPTSTGASTWDGLFAPVMLAQPLPDASHVCHW